MSDDNRDPATGQFAPTSEPIFGKDAVERDAGYVPYKEEGAAQEEGELTVAEAAAELAEEHAPESEIVTYSALDELPDNVTLTIDQAAKMLSDDHAVQEAANEKAEADALRAEVDKLRGVDPETKATEAKPEASEVQPVGEGELDPEIEKALSNPKVQEALSQQVAEVETARQEHLRAVDGAAHVVVAAFLGKFPEFANVTPENRDAAIRAMQQNDPARAAQVAQEIQNTLHIFDQQRVLHQQESQARQNRFQEYARAEDAKFNALTTSESKETMAAIPKLIHEALIEYGVDPAEFGRLGLQSEFLRSAAAQRLLVDAAKYRQITKASKAQSTKILPPVVRPGSSASHERGISGEIATLERQFNSATGDKQIRIAARISELQRKSRSA